MSVNIIRKLKIRKVINKPIKGVCNEIINFIESKINNLTPYRINNESKRVYYMDNNDKWVLEHDLVYSQLWVRSDNFMYILLTRYDLDYDDSNGLVKYMIEDLFQTKFNSVNICDSNNILIEKCYKDSF